MSDGGPTGPCPDPDRDERGWPGSRARGESYKIRDRLADNNVDRLNDKDAAEILSDLFGSRRGAGISMAQRSLALAVNPAEIMAVCLAFTTVLVEAAP